MEILVTGFEPFAGDKVNPSYEAVKALPSEIDGCLIRKAEIPVCFRTGSEMVLRLLQKNSYDAVICTGLAGGRCAVTLEVCAINLMHARIQDNAGYKPVWEKILPDGEDGIFSSLPVRAMDEELKKEGIPSSLSFSAGTFVCNEVMYSLLAFLRERGEDIPAGFIHVPYADEYERRDIDAFSMPVGQIVNALTACIRVLVREIRGTRKTS